MATTAVRDALTEGVDAERLECAAHEVAHGLCWDAGGFAVDEIVIRTGWFGGIGDAYCNLRELRLDEDNINAYLVGMAGGAAGQVRYLTRHRGHWGWSASWRADGNASWDRNQFRRLSSELGSRLSWSAAVTKARRIVDSQAAQHDRLTVELARQGRLSGWSL